MIKNPFRSNVYNACKLHFSRVGQVAVGGVTSKVLDQCDDSKPKRVLNILIVWQHEMTCNSESKMTALHKLLQIQALQLAYKPNSWCWILLCSLFVHCSTKCNLIPQKVKRRQAKEGLYERQALELGPGLWNEALFTAKLGSQRCAGSRLLGETTDEPVITWLLEAWWQKRKQS